MAVAFARVAVEVATTYDRDDVWRPLLRELERVQARVDQDEPRGGATAANPR